MGYIEDTFQKLLSLEELSLSEAEGAMEEIMSGQVSDIKLASWLTALRLKGESADEIAGFSSVMKKHARTIRCDDSRAVDVVGTGGDGANTINISTTAAFVTAGAGVTVAKHGANAVSSKSGSADVLSALGIKIDIEPAKMEECLNLNGMAFLYAPLLHPAMKYAMPVRREMAIRTVFNILGPLSNPAGTKRMVIGVYERRLCSLMAEAAKNLNVEHLLVVHGSDGLDEITTTGATFVSEFKGGSINEYTIGPEVLKLPLAVPENILGGTPEENAQVINSILSGRERGPKADIVLMNAAAAIMVSGMVDSLSDGLKLARESISSGAALEKLKIIAKFSTTG